jgi:NitT/TauT family transport system ATP-binding protein
MLDPIHLPVQGGLAVRVSGVTRTFPGGLIVLDGFDLTVAEGEFVAILGPSGCGKSTLLRLIAGLDEPTSGSVDVARSEKVGYVFQDAHLLPWRNALRNIALPLELRQVPRATRLDTAASAIADVGLSDFGRRYPAELSGGMRMRVSLARALVTGPRLLLLDEPFAALDEITRTDLDVQLRQLWIARRMTVLFVTHSISEATFLADRAIVLSRRPARIVLDMPIDLGLERHNTLRGEPEFARCTSMLLRALEQGDS